MRAQCSVTSATLRGVEAIPVTVEVVVGNGLPGISIVGMGDTAIQEARERVRSAIQASGFTMPVEKIVVNLAPGSLKKSGTGFDLPIAVGILAATGQIPLDCIERKLFVGELSLEGPVRPVLGMLAFGICAHRLGYDLVSSGDHHAPIDGLTQLSLKSLGRLHHQDPFQEVHPGNGVSQAPEIDSVPDFKDIAGHDVAKRALQIAAAGKHGLLMVGPPGSGKTMLASRLVSILPPLEQTEMMESAVVHSVAGEDIAPIVAGKRPFRKPHHSITTPGLLGGGNPIGPGEISLAHCGVLFLDELAEFKPTTLQGLRQPMEMGSITIVRADGNVRFPADFTLIAASNPCPCGYFGDALHECKCTDGQISRYQGKIGGPLIDRINIQLDIQRLPTSSVLGTGSGTASAQLRQGVMRAYEFRDWRIARSHDDVGGSVENSPSAPKQSPAQIIESCGLDDEANRFLVSFAESEGLSGRALLNTLKVARTIADMEESLEVVANHIAEAMAFRMRCDG